MESSPSTPPGDGHGNRAQDTTTFNLAPVSTSVDNRPIGVLDDLSHAELSSLPDDSMTSVEFLCSHTGTRLDSPEECSTSITGCEAVRSCQVSEAEHAAIKAKYGRFTLFPKIPPELRCKIWRYALPPPKYVEVKPDIAQAEHWNAFVLEKAPECLFVCTEARAEALKSYEKIQGTELGSQTVYCDFDKDLIFFPAIAGGYIGEFLEQMDPGKLIKIKRMAFEISVNMGQWDDLVLDLYALTNLEELFVFDWGDFYIQAFEDATSGELNRVEKSADLETAEVPGWVRLRVLPLKEQMEQMEKKHQDWKAPVLGWYDIQG